MVYVVMTEPQGYTGGKYRRIFITEMKPDALPRVVREWPWMWVGKSERCSFRYALRAAIKISDAMQLAPV